jgi:hypothetical protein
MAASAKPPSPRKRSKPATEGLCGLAARAPKPSGAKNYIEKAHHPVLDHGPGFKIDPAADGLIGF